VNSGGAIERQRVEFLSASYRRFNLNHDMSQRTYIACHQAVSAAHSSPPNSFLDQLIDAINPLPDGVFAQNELHDIYSVMLGALGPYTSLLHRKAVICEVLRVQAAFESDWNWNEGVDINNQHSVTHLDGQETGAFQVSADSMAHDQSLVDCVDRLAGKHDVLTFISEMKANHPLAVEYCARLLRFNTSWCGTINDPNQVIAHVRRDAVAEFQTFLSVGQSPEPPEAAKSSTPPAGAASGTSTAGSPNSSKGDKDCIPKLLQIASDVAALESAQKIAAARLLKYDGEQYPRDGCAITLSVLLQQAGIDVPDTFQAIRLGGILRDGRKWQVIPVGQQIPGDVGSTCGPTPDHGRDHIYLVLKRLNDDEMLVADNQNTVPHSRWASGQGGKTPTKFFLRATDPLAA
jgi:hypothetical protein